MLTIKGTVSKIKIVNFSNRPLVRFTVADVNCLIAAHSLNFLYDVKEGDELVLYGSYNARRQFVVRKYCVLMGVG